MFTPTVPHVTVIANGFQPYSHAECCKSGCVVRWRMRCGLGVREPRGDPGAPGAPTVGGGTNHM